MNTNLQKDIRQVLKDEEIRKGMIGTGILLFLFSPVIAFILGMIFL